MAQEISVCTGIFHSLKAAARTLAERQSYGAVGEFCADIRNYTAHNVIGERSVLAALKHKCAETETVAVLTAGKYLLMREPIALGIAVAAPYPTVKAVIAAV